MNAGIVLFLNHLNLFLIYCNLIKDVNLNVCLPMLYKNSLDIYTEIRFLHTQPI